MYQISPSILSADFMNLERDIHNIEENGGDMIHVDVMDGLFVPNITIGFPVIQSLRKITDLPLDVHLMIDRPLRYVAKFVASGADYVTIHTEADTLENNLEALQTIRALGAKAGVSIKPGTPAEAVLPYLPYCDIILLMAVEPGFGGQKFMAEVLPKLRQIRAWLDEAGSECLLSVDGGVDRSTAPLCKKNGASLLVAGTAYFKDPKRADFVKFIQE